MSHLSPQEVINIEIKLLQSPGKTLTTLHRNHLMQKSEYQNTIFKQFDKKNLSSKLKKMVIGNVHTLIDDSNANLRAFSIVILKLIFGRQEKEQVFWTLKSHLHQYQIDIKKFKQIPTTTQYHDLAALSKVQIKKILVEFLHLLKQSSQECKIQNQCKKYNLALQLLMFFWRTLLCQLQIPEAKNFSKKIPTQICYERLFDFMDIFFRKSEKLYFFQQENLFIQVGYVKQNKQIVDEISIGEYYESEQQYLKMNMKNIESPLRFNVDNLKFSAQTFNPKHQDTEMVNPFQLILPGSSSFIFGKKDMKTSNCSLKSSNAFEKRNFNLPSNRSDISGGNMEDSQQYNPTPSFNQVTQYQAHDFFQPQNESLQSIKNQCSTRGTNARFNMKQSATIISFKNKMMKSSLIKENNRKMKGSLQILPQKSLQFGKDQKKCHHRIKTDENQFVKSIKMPTFNDQRNIGINVIQELQQQRRTMKRSQSQRNSTIRQSQVTNGDDTNRVSLFDINCKKLKTSMQMDEFDFLSQKKTVLQVLDNLNQKYFNQLWGNSTYTCSCSSVKIQKNHLNSNIFQFKYEPQNLKGRNFKKKNQEQIILNTLESRPTKMKSKLNDDFFKKLKAKRQEIKTSNSKNKSDPKHKSKEQQRQSKKPYFTKYSQFIKINDRNRSTSKTPDKDAKSITKTTYPSSFQKFNTFFEKASLKNQNKKIVPSNKGFHSLQYVDKRLSLNNTKSFKQQEHQNFKKANVIPQFQPNFHKLYSTPVTPSANIGNHEESEIFTYRNINTSLQDIVSPKKFNKNGSRKASFNFLSPKNNVDFGKNDKLFLNPSF